MKTHAISVSAMTCLLLAMGTPELASGAFQGANVASSAVPIDIGLADALSLDARAGNAADAGSVAAEEGVTHSGSLWRNVNSKATGVYRITTRSGKQFLTLDAGFRVNKDAPDLKVVLSPHASDRASNRNALDGGVILGLLPSKHRPAEFAIPEGTDLTRFRSVLIHCEQYTKLWSAAPLNEGEVVASNATWVKKSNKVEGAWEIAKITEPAQGEDRQHDSEEPRIRHVIRFSSEFKTKNAPDLKIVLSSMTPRQVESGTALRGGLVVSPLRSHRGEQQYDLPTGVELDAYESVLIHCEEYTKLWAASPIGG